MNKNSISFGIYPGGQLGTTSGMTSGPPDVPDQILEALEMLQGEHYNLMVRCYIIYKGKDTPLSFSQENPQQYAVNGRLLDLVLCFQSFEEEISGWLDFVKDTIQEYHPYISKLQITEEANVDLPVLDGHYPKSKLALVEGIIHAHQLLNEMDLQIPVGFNATPDFNPNRQFWKEIASLANKSFYDALGFVGLDFFPDVFRPIPNADDEKILDDAIKYVLGLYRADLLEAGIQTDIPLHITENGWPTGHDRSEEVQAIRVEKIIRTIYGLRKEFNIECYEFFGLRDADSNNNDIFYQFGMLKDDYTPKKAFFTFKKLIAELGTVAVTG
jgi:hypothetical protein